MRSRAAVEPRFLAFSYQLCASIISSVTAALLPDFLNTSGSYVSARAKAASALPASAACWNIKRAPATSSFAINSAPLLSRNAISVALACDPVAVEVTPAVAACAASTPALFAPPLTGEGPGVGFKSEFETLRSAVDTAGAGVKTEGLEAT